MPGLETAALAVVAGRGARAEDAARSGWSHLLEHMVFKGAGDRSAAEIVEAIEGQGGQVNAATGYERTSYQARVLAGGLPLAMEVLADLVLRPTLEAGDLVREKQVVAQEIAEVADTPDDLVFEFAQAQAFGDHPLGRPVLGTVESLAEATPAALADWRAALYAPESLVVAAAGAVDEAELLALAERAFGGPARAEAADFGLPARFEGGGAGHVRRLEQAHLVFLLPAVGTADPDYFALRLFAEILGGGMASRLFQEAREKRGLAYAIDAYADTYQDAGVLGVYAGCAAGDAAELAEVVAGEIASLAEHVEDAELARAKAQLKGGLFMARESPMFRAEQSAGHLISFDRLIPPAELAADVDAVSAEQMRALAGRMLSAGRSAATVLGPKAALRAAERFERALFGRPAAA